MNHKVFITYHNHDIEIAKTICHALEQNEIKCWMAPRDIPLGSNYDDVIEEAIISCKVMVALLSETAAASQWVNGELNVAFEEKENIIVFALDQTPIKGQCSFDTSRFSQSGETLAIANSPHIQIIDLKSRNVFSLRGHFNRIRDINFSFDGNRLITVSNDKTARIWEVNNKEKEPMILLGHKDMIRTGVFSQNGKYVVTASADGTAKVWDSKSGVELLSYKCSPWGRVVRAEFVNNDHQIVVYTENGNRVDAIIYDFVQYDEFIKQCKSIINNWELTNEELEPIYLN